MCHEAGQSAFLRMNNCIYLFIISYLATIRGTNSLSVLMCRKAVNQSNDNAVRQDNANNTILSFTYTIFKTNQGMHVFVSALNAVCPHI